jgi:opacity protein-like surface antigen
MHAITRATFARAASLLVLAAAPAAAQRTGATSLQLTPYAGYMISGKALEGPLGTSLSNGGGAMYGAQLALKLVPGLALVGNLAYSDPDVRAGVPFFGDVNVGSSTIWMYDGGLQLSLPSQGGLLPITPFVQGGVGAMSYEVSAGPLSTKATNVAWNVGGGLDLAVGRNLGVRLFAKDYIGRFDFQDAAGLDVAGAVTHNVALGVGLKLEF